LLTQLFSIRDVAAGYRLSLIFAMTDASEIETAFDAAIDQAQRAATEGMVGLDGSSARERLGQLESRLQTERAKALERGAVDRDWVQKTIRWVVEWTPESDLTIIAALGRIARLSPPGLS
jgi:hypothetical protein